MWNTFGSFQGTDSDVEERLEGLIHGYDESNNILENIYIYSRLDKYYFF